jgi:hypothetical protein
MTLLDFGMKINDAIEGKNHTTREPDNSLIPS